MWDQIKRWEISRNSVALFAINGFAKKVNFKGHTLNRKFSCIVCHKRVFKKVHFKEHSEKAGSFLALFATNGFEKKLHFKEHT